MFISLMVKFAPGLKITVCGDNVSEETYDPLAALTVKVASPLSVGVDDITNPYGASDPCVEKDGPIDKLPVTI